jgi:ATP-dependent DNA helicase 2 subunit 1
MGDIVRGAMLKSFNPAKYPNPSLQWHYRILQAIALEEELPEKAEDKTLPKYSSIHKRIGALALEWGELLDEVAPADRGADQPKKRKAVTNGREDEADKRIKREKK